MIAEFVGKAIRMTRKREGKTQQELAVMMTDILKATVHQGYVSRVEKNRVGISLSRLELVCRALNQKPSNIIKLAERLAERSTIKPAKT